MYQIFARRLSLCIKSLPAALSTSQSCRAVLFAMSLSTLAVATPVAPPLKSRRLVRKTSPFYLALLEELGGEDVGANQRFYLVTISRVLPRVAAATGYRDLETLTRQDVEGMVRDAFDNPLPLPGKSAGRPRSREGALLELVVVAKEAHADGSTHFHVAVKLACCMRFGRAKLTLQERHKLPSHWSCSHTQLWSALRYLHVATPNKPAVDTSKWVWTHDGLGVDLTEMSRKPFIAVAWRKCGEAAEAKAVMEGTKAPNFTKLDFIALVLSKHLHTKAALLAYAQVHGSPAAQSYVSKHQRRLPEFIEDAQGWADAKADASLEKLTEWEILCKAGEAPCGHALGECPYATAVQDIFAHNKAVLSPHRLAASLRRVLLHGPSKTCRVPFFIGPSNTGKSTLLYPFDDLFSPKQVFHKPALGSTFALRNIVKNKRFIFWDDFRPVEFAHKETVPVATFLSLFIGKETEIQVSQAFSDGNLDVRWKRGVVFTAKEEGLWEPTSRVSAEDVRHLRNRVEEFRFEKTVVALKEVQSCAPCMATWILKYSDEAATGSVPAPLLPITAPTSTIDSVNGYAETMAAAKLSGPIVETLLADVVATGAVHVRELVLSDWQRLSSWHSLRVMEARRLEAVLAAPAAPGSL